MISILVGAVALFAFGALWFTVLFGEMWSKLMDFNPAGNAKAKEMGMTKPLIINFVVNLVIASAVYYVVPQVLAVSFAELVKVMLIVWLGFSFPIYANQAIWERKSWKLVILNSTSGILSLLIITAIVYYMQ